MKENSLNYPNIYLRFFKIRYISKSLVAKLQLNESGISQIGEYWLQKCYSGYLYSRVVYPAIKFLISKFKLLIYLQNKHFLNVIPSNFLLKSQMHNHCSWTLLFILAFSTSNTSLSFFLSASISNSQIFIDINILTSLNNISKYMNENPKVVRCLKYSFDNFYFILIICHFLFGSFSKLW